MVKYWCVDKRLGCRFGCGSRLQVKVPVIMIHMHLTGSLLYMCDCDVGVRDAVHTFIHKMEDESSFDFIVDLHVCARLINRLYRRCEIKENYIT